MTITPEIYTCVVVGSLNPAILQPRWIFDHKILDEQDAKAAFKPGAPVTYEVGPISWFSTSSHFQVSTNTEENNPGEFAARVLDLLRHTPLTAIGNNFSFSIAPDAGSRLLSQFQPAIKAKAETFGKWNGFSTTFNIGLDQARLNLQVEVDAEALRKVSFNFHRDVSSVDEAIAAVRKWSFDKESAKSMLRKLLDRHEQ